METGYKTDTGLVRDNNEDSWFADPDTGLFIVADGVGGQSAGEVASGIAVSEISGYVSANLGKTEYDRDVVFKVVTDAITRANSEICEAASKDSAKSNMATTAVILKIAGSTACIVNVGDSRAYLMRDGQLSQITRDHTLANQLVDDGKLSIAEVKMLSKQGSTLNLFSTITRALGDREGAVPDCFDIQLQVGDILLLCSDGLYDEVSDYEIEDILNLSKEMQDTCEDLVNKALSHGGRDNVTVITVKIGEEIHE